MPKNSRTFRKTYFHNTSQAKEKYREREEEERYQKEIYKLCELLIRALDQLTIHNTKVNYLKKELTLLFSFSEIIKLW